MVFENTYVKEHKDYKEPKTHTFWTLKGLRTFLVPQGENWQYIKPLCSTDTKDSVGIFAMEEPNEEETSSHPAKSGFIHRMLKNNLY